MKVRNLFKRWLALFIVIVSLGIATAAWGVFTGTAATVTSSWTQLCVTSEASQYTNIQFRVKNTGINALTDCKIETWLGPTFDVWVTYDATWTDCQTLAAGTTAIWEISGSAHERLRVMAKSASGTTTYCKPQGTR